MDRDEAITFLSSMGFSSDVAAQAFDNAGGDVETAYAICEARSREEEQIGSATNPLLVPDDSQPELPTAEEDETPAAKPATVDRLDGGDAGPSLLPRRSGEPSRRHKVSRRVFGSALDDQFRLPDQFEYEGSFDDAKVEDRDRPARERRYLLVEIVREDIFQCLDMTRSYWNDVAIRELVGEHFLFLQYDFGHAGFNEDLTGYYNDATDPLTGDSFPHVSIFEPLTGIRLKTWEGMDFPPPSEFYSQLVEFLDNPKESAAPRKKRPREVDVEEMDEDVALQRALQMSKEEEEARIRSTAAQDKPDSLETPQTTEAQAAQTTQTPQETAQTRATAEPSPPPYVDSEFDKISRFRPHTEPENNPATTTRIQIRHENVRVIRRFLLGDSVRRIYEWLKAAPLPGKENVEFELKAMPQGRDLIEELNKTIEEAGLKQATVMIEFAEE